MNTGIKSNNTSGRYDLLILAACLIGLLVFFFYPCFEPKTIVFSNDGPLGACAAQYVQPPASFVAMWNDLTTIGSPAGYYPVGITGILFWFLGPIGFSKLYVPSTLLFIGLCAWVLLWRLRLGPTACILGALAVVLNSGLFSTTAWGVGPQIIAFGLNFLAMAAIRDSFESPYRTWIKVCLAGFAVGMGVVEAADIGAYLSLLTGMFTVYLAWASSNESLPKPPSALAGGFIRLAVVAGCAGFLALHAISALISTQIHGIVGTGQDERTKEQQWDWATEWSLPKVETFSLFVPGLFGYRMDTPDGGNYWGRVGQDPAWDRFYAGKGPNPGGAQLRFTGGGAYAGVLVTLVAVWAACESFRRKNPVFDQTQRRLIWFWTAISIIGVLFAYGRFAPFYRLVYSLPYFSTIRNATKFLDFFAMGILMLFAYGIHGLTRRSAAAEPLSAAERARTWWSALETFDKRWIAGSLLALLASVAGWTVYAHYRTELEHYLWGVGFGDPTHTELAAEIAGFSIRHVGLFVMFLGLSVATIILVLVGTFNGSRAKWGGVLLGILLVTDLVAADRPWLKFWDYAHKYASNPVVDSLREKPYEHRVAMEPFDPPPQFGVFTKLYGLEWSQHLFLYYDIQSLDVIQMSRVAEDWNAYQQALAWDGTSNTVYRIARRWELTNTRYLLGPAGYMDIFNQQLDRGRNRFRFAALFDLVAKPGVDHPQDTEDITAEMTTNGPYAVFDFTGALPRAKLYSDWQVTTNDAYVLQQLGSATFDPWKSVFVSGSGTPKPAANADQNTDGSVTFANYSPTKINLEATNKTAAVLLLNDKFDSNWKVAVDGKPAPLLRCNYIMRGVYLEPGSHQVQFRFAPPIATLYVSLLAILIALGLLVFLVVPTKVTQPAAAVPASEKKVRAEAKVMAKK